ncbi:hypothetical protein K492DRAFT_9362 [Lichtheimia hyalospora FSU 10163]|nr:hypothetical protein K492DRAFT_9362 [Lichtheimia hyalospora FSU 10163]
MSAVILSLRSDHVIRYTRMLRPSYRPSAKYFKGDTKEVLSFSSERSWLVHTLRITTETQITIQRGR